MPKAKNAPKPEPKTDDAPVALSLEEELASLKAQLAKAQARESGGTRLKVSKKGAVSLYGMGRYPTTLYASQWEKVLDMADEIRSFIESNEKDLARKGEQDGGEAEAD